MRRRTRTTLIAAAAAVAVGGATATAFATGAVPVGDDLDRAGTIAVDEADLPEDDAAEEAALAELATVGEAAAGAAAVAGVGGGEVVRASLEEEDGSVVWDVVVRAADGSVREVLVDAGDASVLGSERDDDDLDDRDDDDRDGERGDGDLDRAGTVAVDEAALPEDDAAEQAALAQLATVDEAAAGAAAVAGVGGGQVVRASLEEEDGSVVWDVRVRAADGSVREVLVDAGDASVLGSERDDDDLDDSDDD